MQERHIHLSRLLFFFAKSVRGKWVKKKIFPKVPLPPRGVNKVWGLVPVMLVLCLMLSCIFLFCPLRSSRKRDDSRLGRTHIVRGLAVDVPFFFSRADVKWMNEISSVPTYCSEMVCEALRVSFDDTQTTPGPGVGSWESGVGTH